MPGEPRDLQFAFWKLLSFSQPSKYHFDIRVKSLQQLKDGLLTNAATAKLPPSTLS